MVAVTRSQIEKRPRAEGFREDWIGDPALVPGLPLGALGVGGKVAFYGALMYTILPIDLLPDPIYLDDMGVLAGALIYLTRLVHKHRAAQRRLPGQPDSPPEPGRLRRPVS